MSSVETVTMAIPMVDMDCLVPANLAAAMETSILTPWPTATRKWKMLSNLKFLVQGNVFHTNLRYSHMQIYLYRCQCNLRAFFMDPKDGKT